MSTEPAPPPGIDPTVPSTARTYDYILGGKDNYQADRQAAKRYLAVDAKATVTARAHRAFGKRAVSYLAEQGIRQFVDLGSGIPTTPPSVHEAVRAVEPCARVVYVDHDPVVVAHSAALRSVGAGLATIVADVRQPETVLDHPELRELIDFGEPVGVVIFGVLHAIEDAEDPAGIVRRFQRQMAPGSYLGISHFSTRTDPALVALYDTLMKATGPTTFRADDEVFGFFEGFDLVEPGLVDITDWRPDHDYPSLETKIVCGVGRKSS
ncbi:MAG: SAM-dependent methyltransferase [Pseudonocardiaceae bacterium]